MTYFISLVLLLTLNTYFYDAAKLIDPKKCKAQGGCGFDWECVVDSECRYFDAKQDCGWCVCKAGFEPKGAKCQPIKGYTTTTTTVTTTTPKPTTTTRTSTTTRTTTATKKTSTTRTSTTTRRTTTTTKRPTTTGTTTQSPFPPTPRQVVCSDYDCTPVKNVQSNGQRCKRQLVVSSRPCNVEGGGSCYGQYCLRASPGNDYCMCSNYRVGRMCAVDKPGSCSSATGNPPSGAAQLSNTRLRNPTNKDHGSVYARHFAHSLTDCIKLCQWTRGLCRSVNYGQIKGTNVCELMSIAANRNSLLTRWLEGANGWQYVQLGPV